MASPEFAQHFTVLESRYVSDLGALGSIGHSKESLSDHAILLIDIAKDKTHGEHGG